MKLVLLILIFTSITVFAQNEQNLCIDVFKPFVFRGNFNNSAMHFNHSIDDRMLLTPNKSMLGASPYTRRTQDLSGLKDTHLAKNIGKAWEESDFYYKFQTIKDFPISHIIAAPGHSTLRSVDNIKSLSKFIKQEGGNHFGNDKLILNIITDNQKNIINIDGWNGHHRLVAYLDAGKKNIGQIGEHNLTILVNGNYAQWDKWPHILPAHGVDIKKFKSWNRVLGSDDASAISVDGAISNYSLGSRQTVSQVYENVLRTDQANIGVMYIELNNSIEQSVIMARNKIKKMDFDEIVLVPRLNNLDERTITNYIEDVSQRLRSENKINLLINDSRVHRDTFDDEVVLKYVKNLYAVKKVTLLTP